MRGHLDLCALLLLGMVDLRAEPPKGTPAKAATVVTLDAVPDAARRALERAAQNHQIGLVIRRHAKGEATYETTVQLGNSRVFIKVTGSGEVMERRPLDPSAAPSPKPRQPKPRPRPTP